MAYYKKMYHLLFNKITDIIEDLQAVQRQAEEIFMEQEEQIVKLPTCENKKEDSVSTIPQK